MELRTARLLIREFQVDDWLAVFDYRRDARYLRFYPEDAADEGEVRAFVTHQIEQQWLEPRKSFQVAITLPDSGQMIGNVGIRLRSLLHHQTDSRQADIGYELDPHHWGHGYATEAAQAMLAFGFKELGLHRVWADCLAENKASARVLEKLGMQLEGRLRDNEYFKSRWWDTLIYAVLEHEWKEPAENLQNARSSIENDTPLRFRSALPSEADRLTEIAFAAKRYWGYPERWINLWREQLRITQEYIRSHLVILAELNGGIIGFYGLSVADHTGDLDYLWVDPPYMGHDIGQALIEHARRTAAGLGATRLVIIADPNAEGFYRRMGADKIGESVYELEGKLRRLPLMEIRSEEQAGG